MDYSPEQLQQIEELASKLTPIRDIAVLMGLNADVLRLDLRDSANPVVLSYRRGKATTARKLREQEIELAMLGSPLAVQLTASYLVNMDSDEDL